MRRRHHNSLGTTQLGSRTKHRKDGYSHRPNLEGLEPRRLLAADPVARWVADEHVILNDNSELAQWLDTVASIPAEVRGTPILLDGVLNGRDTFAFDASDGVDTFVTDKNVNPLAGVEDFSVAVVFATDSNTHVGNNAHWFNNSGLVDSNALGFTADWGLSMNQTGQLSFGMGSGFNKPIQTQYTTNSFNDGNLHTVVVTRGGSEVSIFVDDDPAVTNNEFNDVRRGSLDMAIGSLLNNRNGFNGQIAQVQLFDRQLTSAEVSELQAELNTYYDNQVPVALNDAYEANEDTFTSVSVEDGILVNDQDTDGDVLTAVIVDPPLHGVLRLNDDGSFLYSPDQNFFGTDTFTYTANDFRPSNIATVNIEVQPTYDAPISRNDNYKSTPLGTLKVSTEAGVLVNDNNFDQAVLTAQLVDDATHGTVNLNSDGSFEYSANGFSGIARFTYQIDDGVSLTSAATVSIIVNTPPQAAPDEYEATEDDVLNVPVSEGVMRNDLDAEDEPFTLTLATSTTNGELVLQGDGSFQYTPNPNFDGTDQFTYFLNDGIDDSEPTTVTIRVTPINDLPSSSPDAYAVTGRRLTVNASTGVLANDIDFDGPVRLMATLVTSTENGTLEFATDGSFEYTPNDGFRGEDRFTYFASDSLASTHEKEVRLIVQPSSSSIAEPTGDSIVTINEVMYHPTGPQSRGEWIELHNQMGINMDISGWALTDGIFYEFPEGTVIPGNGYLVIASNPAALQADTGFEHAVGPFTGRLNNSDERIVLRNNSNRLMDAIEYLDGDEWPVGADGSGASLAKSYVHDATADPENWEPSLQTGGTPGAENFPVSASVSTKTVLSWGSVSKFNDSGTDFGKDWRTTDFDDSAWQDGIHVLEANDAQYPPENPGGLAEPGVDLLSYWPIEAVDRPTFIENLVPGAPKGTFVDRPRWTNDEERGRVIKVDGRNDAIKAGELPPIAVEDDFTWSFWFRQDDRQKPDGVILGNRAGGQESPSQFIKFTPTKFEYYNDGPDPSLNYQIRNLEWFHLAVVKDGPTLTYYANGEQVAQGTTTHDFAGGPLWIGGDPDANEYGDGAIDDVALWSRALPLESIQGLADGTFTPLDAPTVFADGPLIPAELSDETTSMSGEADTYYVRQTFRFDGNPDRADLSLSLLLDDGAVFYLNDQEIYRHNMPEGVVNANTRASAENNVIDTIGPISLPSTGLQEGENVFAVEIHKSGDPVDDALYAAQLQVNLTPILRSDELLPVLNEISGEGETIQVEIFNPHDQAIELNGFRIRNYVFPAGQLDPGAYLVLDQSHLGVNREAGDELFLMSPRDELLADGHRIDTRTIGRNPALDDRWFYPTMDTPGSANVFDVTKDIVFNELMYHAPGVYVSSLDRLFENNEEWIELYNRSDTRTIDLSGWRLADGVDFEFPVGTEMAPNSYLVIANSPEQLLSNHPDLSPHVVLGPFDRSLSNRGENLQLLNQHGNPVDEVHYHDGGTWAGNADGYSSSLELRDPHSDNSAGTSWAASDESHQTTWETITVRGPAQRLSGDPRQYQEFLLGLLDGGQVLIDNVSVIEHPDTPDARQLIQNGHFDNDAIGSEPEKWRIIGTQHGTVIQDPDDPNNHVLLLEATGPTEHMHNNAGTTLKDGDEFVDINHESIYEISLRARYRSGSNQLNSRLYFNRLPLTTRLQTPVHVGTPGKVNSQRVENIGPTLKGLIHSPAVPDVDQPVTISVAAHDPDSIGSVTLQYSVNGGQFSSLPMTLGPDGRYQAAVPGQEAASLVHFYVEGTDSQGASTMAPFAGPEARALYRVQDGNAMQDQRHNVRILMTAEDTELLHRTTNVMSNDRLGATVIYRESEIYYDAGVRLKGSQRGRDKVVRAGFNIGFSPEQLFRDVHSTIGVDRSGSGDEYSQEEIIVRQIVNHAGSVPQIYDDLIHVVAPDPRHTGSAMLNLARYNDVFLDSQYVNGSAGTAFEYELIYFPTNTIDRNDPESLKRPNPDSVVGVSMVDQGDDKELYRWHWLIENNRREDNYAQIMSGLKVLGQDSSTIGYHDQLEEIIDVDQWLRAFAVTILTGIGDNYSSGSAHNGIFYGHPTDNRLLYLPWDMDFSFTQGATGSLETNRELRKMMEDPGYKHAYYGHVLDIVTTTVNPGYMDAWIDHFNELIPGKTPNFNPFAVWIDRRDDSALGFVERMVEPVSFEITSMGPIDAGDATTVSLHGTGWVDVREIRLAGSEIPLNVNWVTPNQWQMDVPISSDNTEVVLEAYGFQGDLVGTQTIGVATTGESPLAQSLRVSEINFNPGDPSGDELHVDNDQFEFVEVRNVGTKPINLEGVEFVQVERERELEGIRFAFDAQTLDPNEVLVVPRNRDAFISRYGNQTPLAQGIGDANDSGVFSDSLANGGETITLIDGDRRVIQQFVYSDDWYDETDGDGNTLDFPNPFGADLNAWNDEDYWCASTVVHGTPGIGNVPGDSNFDGVFDEKDIVAAFTAGKYEDGNSTWAEGDWNRDGEFTSEDFVFAFTAGYYVHEPDLAAAVATSDVNAIDQALAEEDHPQGWVA